MPRTRLLPSTLFLCSSLLLLSSCTSEQQKAPDSDYLTELKFKVALHEERWDDALDYCSPALNKAAEKYTSAKNFFEETTPLKEVMNQQFNRNGWNDNARRYSVGVNWRPDDVELPQNPHVLSKQELRGSRETWRLTSKRADTKAKWLFDWEPVPVDDLFKRRLRLRADWEAREKAFREGMQEKFESVEIRLSISKQTFKAGASIPVHVDLVNSHEEAIHFIDQWDAERHTRHLQLRTDAGLFVAHRVKPPRPPSQRVVRGQRTLAGGETVRLYSVDLQTHFELTKPGIYTAKHHGHNIIGGDQIVFEENDPHAGGPGFPEWMNQTTRPGFTRHGFVSVGKTIPANTLKIEVVE